MERLIFLLLLVPIFAQAVDVKVQWTPATSYTDKTAMDYGEISGFQVHYSVDAPLKPVDVPIWVSGENKYTLDLDLKPRVRPYVVQVGVQTVSIYEEKSSMSNVISQEILVQPAMKPTPVAPKITIDITCGKDCDRIQVIKK